MSYWEWPQWIMAGLIGLEAVGAVVLNGQPRGPYDFGQKMIDIGALLVLLGAGGFWS